MFFLKKFINETEQTTLSDDLKKFEYHRDALMSVDKAIGVASGIDALMLITFRGWLGTLIDCGLAVGIYLYATQYSSRQMHSTEFQKQLTQLLSRYQTLATDPKMTHNREFLDLLTALAPFVSYEHLVPWDLTRTSPRSISLEFMEILSQPPHSCRFVMVGDRQPDAHLSSQPRKTSGKYATLFAQGVAELKKSFYGLPEEELHVERLVK